MASRAVYTVLAACVVSLSGCGTMSNLMSLSAGNPDNDAGPYGGVRWSAKLGVELAEAVVRPDNDNPDRAWNAFVTLWLFGIDVPLSAALDTATLPLILLDSWEKAGARKSDPEPALAVTTPPSPAVGQPSGQ